MTGVQPKTSQPQVSDGEDDGLFKVILTKMHYTSDQEEIKRELESLGHKVVRISLIRSVCGEPLPLFLIELERNENNNEIFEIRRLWGMAVAFEPIHKKNMLIQNLETGDSDDEYTDGLWCGHHPVESLTPEELFEDFGQGPSFPCTETGPSTIRLPSCQYALNEALFHSRMSSPNSVMYPFSNSVDLNRNLFPLRAQHPPSRATSTQFTTPLNVNGNGTRHGRPNSLGAQRSSSNSTSSQLPDPFGPNPTPTLNPNDQFRGPSLPQSFTFNVLPNSSDIRLNGLRPRGPPLFPSAAFFSRFPNPTQLSVNAPPPQRTPRPSIRRGPLPFPLLPPTPPPPPSVDPFSTNTSDYGRELKSRLLYMYLGTTRMEQMLEYMMDNLSSLMTRMYEILPTLQLLNAFRANTFFTMNNTEQPSTSTSTAEPTPSSSSYPAEPTPSTSSYPAEPISLSSSYPAEPTPSFSYPAVPTPSTSSYPAEPTPSSSSYPAESTPSSSSIPPGPTPLSCSNPKEPTLPTPSNLAEQTPPASPNPEEPTLPTASNPAEQTPLAFPNPAEPITSTSSDIEKSTLSNTSNCTKSNSSEENV